MLLVSCSTGLAHGHLLTLYLWCWCLWYLVLHWNLWQVGYLQRLWHACLAWGRGLQLFGQNVLVGAANGLRPLHWRIYRLFFAGLIEKPCDDHPGGERTSRSTLKLRHLLLLSLHEAWLQGSLFLIDWKFRSVLHARLQRKPSWFAFIVAWRIRPVEEVPSVIGSCIPEFVALHPRLRRSQGHWWQLLLLGLAQ